MWAIRNPVLILAWGLPAVAVAASILSLIVALRTPESELPEQYHWEGFQLDRDFSQAARATKWEVRATLAGFEAGGRCELALKIDGPAPAALELYVAHATRPALDQRVMFTRSGQAASAGVSTARYVGACAAARDAHWRLELVDRTDGWAVRQTVRGPLTGAVLDATAGDSE